MNVRAQTFYEFGHFRFNATDRLLLRDGEVIALTPKVYDLLVVFVESGGRTVDKDELMKTLWPDTFVEEGNLTQNISVLRKALGEGGNGNHFIETIPRRGYRFVADVKQVSVDSEMGVISSPLPSKDLPARSAHARTRILLGCLSLIGLAIAAYVIVLARRPSGPTVIRSIAVLPFKVMGAEAGDEYLGFGMADLLITQLSDLKQIQVRPSAAVLKYRGQAEDPVAVGRDLKVDVVVNVNIHKVADTIRVTVQPLRVEDGWLQPSTTFDEKFTDWPSTELKISEQVAEYLKLKLSGDESRRLAKGFTTDSKAFELFMRGSIAIHGPRDQHPQAVKFFEQATERDKRFGLAYAALADAHVQQAIDRREAPKKIWPLAEEAALKALAIDQDCSEAHTALGQVKMYQDRDWTGAKKHFDRAIELSPGSPDGYRYLALLLQTRGLLEEATSERRKALQRDPTNLRVIAEMGMTLYLARNFEDAIRYLKGIIATAPDDSFAHWLLGQAYLQKGDLDAATKELEIASGQDSRRSEAALAHAYARAGHKMEAEKLLTAMKDRLANGEYVSAFDFALVYTGLGDKNQAFKWLHLSIDELSPNLSIKVNPMFESLRPDPEFAKILHRVALDQ